MVQINGLTMDAAEDILKSTTPKEVLEFYNTPYEVSSDKLKFYDTNGFVVIEKILTEYPLKYARKVIQSAVLVRKGHDERALKDKSAYQQSFLQCGFLCWDYPAINDIVFGKRFAGVAKELMKANDARLWHDQALFKEPGGRITDVHQDSSYWPVASPDLTTTLWLALNDVPVEKGCLYFYPGSHKKGREYVDIFNSPHKPELLKNIDTVSTPISAGDATFHSGLTYHGANPNNTEEMREGMTVIYLADGNRFDASDDRNATHKSCDGLRHGEIINTKYTPVLS